MGTVNIALLQMNSCGTDQGANLTKGEAVCRRAREMGADIALFPEMWNVGYTFDRTAHEGAPNHRSKGPSSEDLWQHRSCAELGMTPLVPRCKAWSRCGKRRR
jgi:N-carbamoylputrescine amidase